MTPKLPPQPGVPPLNPEPPAHQPAADQLRAAVFYTKGEALGGAARDDLLIVRACEQVGLAAESVNLAHLTLRDSGGFELTDPATGTRSAWQPPHAALMYHGALAPANTAVMLSHIEDAGCVVANGSGVWQTMTDKLPFFQRMRRAGVATIPTRLVRTAADFMAAQSEFGWPLVCKPAIGTEGGGVQVVHNAAELQATVIGRLNELGDRMIAQPFVESQIDETLEAAIMDRIGPESLGMRNDFRIMSVRLPDAPPQVVSAFHRVATHPDHVVNNVARGAREVNIEFSELHPADQATVWEAIAAMPEAQIVGWDLIGRPGDRIIMEANSGPGLPILLSPEAEQLLLHPCAELIRRSAEHALSVLQRADRPPVHAG